nr:hypothetical protein [Burkholderia gladioli]
MANDPSHFGPEPASLTVEAITGPGCADVLAWKTPSHDVNNSAPRSAVKGSNVIPNREWRKGAIVLPSDKDGLGVGIKFNGAYASVSPQLTCKDSSTSTREKMKLIHKILLLK